MIENILFDLDGTLTDPAIGITKSICYALEKMGRVPPSPETLTWCIGPPLQGSLAGILETECQEESGRCLAFYRERFSVTGLYENTVYEGVREMLESLRGFNLYVATSKPTIYAEEILRYFDLRKHFVGVYGSELDGTRTNKANLIKFLLEKERLAPEECVMVGDRSHDIVGAAANGVSGFGVLYGYGSREELSEAERLAQSPHEVAELLDRVALKNLPAMSDSQVARP